MTLERVERIFLILFVVSFTAAILVGLFAWAVSPVFNS